MIGRINPIGFSVMVFALGGVLAVKTLGCSSAGRATKPPSRIAEEWVLDRIRPHETREVFEVRLNPTGCGAPPFEVRLDKSWIRVFLEPDDPTGPAGLLAERLETLGNGEGSLPTSFVRGRLLMKVRFAPNRSPYPILVVLGECAADSCAVGAPPAEPAHPQ